VSLRVADVEDVTKDGAAVRQDLHEAPRLDVRVVAQVLGHPGRLVAFALALALALVRYGFPRLRSEDLVRVVDDRRSEAALGVVVRRALAFAFTGEEHGALGVVHGVQELAVRPDGRTPAAPRRPVIGVRSEDIFVVALCRSAPRHHRQDQDEAAEEEEDDHARPQQSHRCHCEAFSAVKQTNFSFALSLDCVSIDRPQMVCS
jgi:hypothetical protein